MNTVLFWATVLSPIVGVIAIIVALIVARSSTKEIKRQVDATYNLLDVFVAAQNPTMLEAKKQYEQQIPKEKLKQRKELYQQSLKEYNLIKKSIYMDRKKNATYSDDDGFQCNCVPKKFLVLP